MAKKVSSNTHKTRTREYVTVPNSEAWTDPCGRKARRKAEREAATAAKKRRIRARIAANPRLVRA